MGRRRKRLTRKQLNFRFFIGLSALCLMFAVWGFWDDYFDDYIAPNIVARVLFSETASCTPAERVLVAGVIQNRIGQRAFGNYHTMNGVVRQPGAFSCVGDEGNSNWRKTLHPEKMSRVEQEIWRQCDALAGGDFPPAVGPSGALLVYYHDKSISKPRSWDNDKWRAVMQTSTPHFIFYSIVAVKK